MRAAPFLAAFGLLAASLAGVAEAGTTLLHNAKIYTVNSAQPWASALVIDEDGSIVAIGSDEDVAEYVDDETEQIDLDGRLVLPGFQDTHAHVLDASSEAQAGCELSPEDDVPQWLHALKTCAADAEGDWLLGSGVGLHALLEA